ncbi:MAG TPA: tetratricopeptide repeat protein [Verrucomicrobiae bacterium]|nr:tetratricopeptide repeat protein [Verrucomicrobiae bacterium]
MASISNEEIQQLLRTVEMFEAITQSQPEDYQSWEILKEAYNKLGRPEDSLRTSKKLAQAYITLGQISQAILEYEGILQEYPSDPEALAALGDLEAKTSQLSTARQPSGAPSLREDSKPTQPAPSLTVGATAPHSPSLPTKPKGGDANQALVDLLIVEKFVTPQAVEPLLKRLATARPTEDENAQPPTLVQMLADEQIAKLDDVMSLLVDRSGLPYLPLSTYDVDRDAACLLPREFCFANCLISFDLISRSVLIATANPFDMVTRNHAEGMLSYNVFWYVAAPAEVYAALRRAHGLDLKKPQSVRLTGNQ